MIISENISIDKRFLLLELFIYDGNYADKSLYVAARAEFLENTTETPDINLKNANLNAKKMLGGEMINKYFLDFTGEKSNNNKFVVNKYI